MILSSLTLENIGSFFGRHEIDLCPTSEDKPIVLIGALNGSGKTTILESLQLGLYGKRAKSLFRIKTGYDDYLKKLVNRKALPSDRACVELVLVQEEAGSPIEYRIVRSWTFNRKQPVEVVEVFVNGAPDAALTATWDEEVESLIPRNLSHLFFFDGEKIEMLADPTQSAEILRTGVYSLLGIELVDQLHTDLAVYRRRLKKSAANDGQLNGLSKIEKQLESQMYEITALMDKSAAIERDIDAAYSAQSKARSRFQQHGGEIYENRSALEKERIEILSAIRQIDDELRDRCGDVLPLCIVETQLRDLQQIYEAEKRSADSLLLQNEYKARDERLVDWLAKQTGTDDELPKRVADYLSSDRKKLEQLASIDATVQLPEQAGLALSTLLISGLPKARDKAMSLQEKRTQLTRRHNTVDRSLEMMPEESVIRRYIDDKASAEAKHDFLRKEQRKLEEQMRQLRVSVEQQEKARDRLLNEIRQSGLDGEERTRLAEYSAKVQHVLNQLRQETLVTHLANLESHISDALQRLLRKESLVDNIRIDPDTFNVTLTANDGHEIPPQLISAGERQLLAIAMLWGLGKAAGRKIPIVIDTPLGRLDSVHRKQLVDEYFPDASHQVVLLSTDEEIDEELSAKLSDSIAHRYMLHYDDSMEHTTVRSGYFWQ